MSYPVKLEKNIYRIVSTRGHILRFEVRINVSETDRRLRSFSTEKQAVAYRDKCLRDREALRNRPPIDHGPLRQWGFV